MRLEQSSPFYSLLHHSSRTVLNVLYCKKYLEIIINNTNKKCRKVSITTLKICVNILVDNFMSIEGKYYRKES